jgi:uncharacterized membrane protein
MRCIEKWATVPRGMRSRAGLWLVFWLMVSLPLTAVVSSAAPDPSLSGEHATELPQNPTGVERLLQASAHWNLLPEPALEAGHWAASTGFIHLAAGSFDPLVTEGPDVPTGFGRLGDAQQTGLAMVQLHRADGVLMEALAKEHGLTVLDVLHDEAWLVRLPDPPMDAMHRLNADERIRWVGHQAPGWRVEPALLKAPDQVAAFTFVPTPDLHAGGYDALSTDLVRYGANDAWCDAWLCRASVQPDFAAVLVQNVAHDGRIMWTEPSATMSPHNAVAWSIAGVADVTSNASFTLDGSGEMIAITDTGLDQNHPDLTGRVAGTLTQFGLDPSPADTNTGHGTHVAITVAGNGTGNVDARGVAPAANIVMYALEHDPTGVFGRIGSIYDMLRDAEQKTARIAVNAWGLNGNYGQYTADARSVDVFVRDRSDLTPVFSVGDRGAQGASQVTSPGTAKNVLAVGASTTGAGGTEVPGQVANFSSLGPALDGRIKPDVVAPGVGVCSGLAEEARFPAGPDCLTGTHAGGNAYYMSLSGTSQATAVASGVAALTREFIREQVGVNSPSSALVKAVLINGAEDMGAPDIPNALEGWGQVDLERTVMPMNGATPLDTFVDDTSALNPGYALLYSFDLNPGHGVDITLAWTDEAGSANTAQNQPRLVNDLDVTLQGPNGELYLGNVFSNGHSTTGGSSDTINNVERIRIDAGSLPDSLEGWTVRVDHKQGTTQRFALVVAAVATPTPQADLVVFNGSIVTSSTEPLRNDLISIRMAWMNQGTASTAGFDVLLEDLTTGQTLATASRNGLAPGALDSYSIFHQFTTTGTHRLRLSIDTTNTVSELNDGTTGVDNNIWEQDVEVKALGVRVVVNNDDGTVPQTPEERADNAVLTLDVANDSGIDIPLTILHEGTGNQSVVVSATTVQVPVPGRDNFFLPSEDAWSRTFSDAPNFVLTEQGSEDANKTFNLRLEDLDADFETSPENPRFVRAGRYVVEVTARYEFQPTVAHTQRIFVDVPQIDQVQVVAAGTSGLQAQPGASTFFSISVRNTGNAPAQYSVECESASRWQLMLGGSNSSRLEFEPLNLLEYLPMSIRIIVPLVADGQPAAGDTDEVTCFVTSSTDPSMNFTETVTITVMPQESFTVDLSDDDGPLGPSQTAAPISVDSGQRVHLNVTVENTGNIAVDLEVSALPDNPQWAMQVMHGEDVDNRRVTLTLAPGQTARVELLFAVPLTAEEDDFNTYTIRTERSLQNFVQNVTTLIVREELGVELTAPEGNEIPVNVSDAFSYGVFTVRNTGNVPLGLTWTHGLLPDGWTLGFANPSTYLEPREVRSVRLGLVPPAQTPAGEQNFDVLVVVNGTSAGRFVEASSTASVRVEPSMFANMTVVGEATNTFQSVSRDAGAVQTLTIRNDGNLPLSDTALTAVLVDALGEQRTDWEVELSINDVDGLAVGASQNITLTLRPNSDTARGLATLHLNLTANGVTVATLEQPASVESATGGGGLFAVLPPAASAAVVAVLLIVLLVAARRMKRSGELKDDGLDLVAPDTHARPDHLGERREEALDISSAINDIASAEVSDEEIAAAIMQSMDLPSTPAATPAGLPPGGLPPRALPPMGLPPAGMPPAGLPPAGLPPAAANVAKAVPNLPPPAPAATLGPPLPPTGLPPGWTMEQWQHYGEEWLRRQQG